MILKCFYVSAKTKFHLNLKMKQNTRVQKGKIAEKRKIETLKVSNYLSEIVKRIIREHNQTKLKEREDKQEINRVRVGRQRGQQN
jgi:hypothetical protein